MKTLAFGEVLWDVYPDSEYIGGAPLNFAAHFKKCGGNSWILTSIGDDSLGKKTIDEIQKMGISTDYISCSDKETGKCLVTLDEKQIPTYNLLDDVAYDYIKRPELLDESFDVFYFGTLSLRNKNNREVANKIVSENNFGDIFVDLNIRPPFYSKEVVQFALSNATIVKISDEELPTIMELIGENVVSVKDDADKLSKLYPQLKIIIITLGAKGSYVYDSVNDKSYEQEAVKVDVVSTVGAGDSFSAAFLAKYLKTTDIKKALSLATKVSGFVVSQKGAIPDYDINNM